MKKVKILLVIALVGMLAACGNGKQEGKEPKGKNKGEKVTSKIADVSIQDGWFIDPIGGDNEDDQETIALKVKVKNNSQDKMYIFEDSFFMIEKDDDEKIDVLDLGYDSQIDMINGELSPGKSMSGVIAFNVKSDQKYKLNFSSGTYDADGKAHSDVVMTLDPSKYADSKKALEEPLKAVAAYIDVVLLQKENADYETLVGNDAAADIALINKEYVNSLKDTFFHYRLTDDENATAFESYVGNQSEAVEVSLTSLGNVGDRAQVQVDFKGISNQAVSDLMSTFKDEYDEKNKEYDSKKRDQFVVSKLEDIYSEAEIGEPRNEIKVILSKKDDKWTIDYKNDDGYDNKKLVKAFLGEVD